MEMNNKLSNYKLECLYNIYKFLKPDSVQQLNFLDTLTICGCREQFEEYRKTIASNNEKKYTVNVKFIHSTFWNVSATSEEEAIRKVDSKIESYSEDLHFRIDKIDITAKEQI